MVYKWLGTGMVAAGLLMFVVVATDPSSLADFGPPFGMILSALYARTRGPRCGAVMTEQGVTVVNPFRQEHARWGDISSFSIGRYGPYPEMGFVELRDGRRIHIWGIQSKNPVFTRDEGARKLVDQLNKELRESGLR